MMRSAPRTRAVDRLTGPADRVRIGVVAPFDMALDDELSRWLPNDVSLHCTRTPHAAVPVSLKQSEVLADLDQISQCVTDLKVIEPVGYAYACTSGSFVHGLAGERELAVAMELAGGAPAITTSGALLAALAALGVSSVCVATPYDAAVTERLVAFLDEAGVSVSGQGFLGLKGKIWQVPYRTTARMIMGIPRSGAEAVLISCTNLSSYDLIAPLEVDLGIPVISANQATVWAALRLTGRQLIGPGQTLAGQS
ncbi:maleate cis-trans isomerase family protein [Microlunatus speluncae]|uniref:maleate cis-trans isomerase family protein n=1 Tax=Microlunatus speluncae TaxID=2594267 RepID=UPI00126675F7|nr:decarboxylase [Microlunatus speluncae]